MLRSLYLSPLGRLISAVLNLLATFTRPFMVYGYRDGPSGRFRKTTRLSSSATLISREKISISENCWVWHHSIIDGSNGVTIEEGVQIGAWVGVFSHGSQIAIRLHGRDYINIEAADRLGYTRAPVTIGAYTFIGAGALIMPGVTIGKGCIVAAGAIVNKSLPDHAIAVGSPARVVGSTLGLDTQYLLDPEVQATYYDPDLVPKLIERALAAQQESQRAKDETDIDTP